MLTVVKGNSGCNTSSREEPELITNTQGSGRLQQALTEGRYTLSVSMTVGSEQIFPIIKDVRWKN